MDELRDNAIEVLKGLGLFDDETVEAIADGCIYLEKQKAVKGE